MNEPRLVRLMPRNDNKKLPITAPAGSAEYQRERRKLSKTKRGRK